MFKSFFIKYVRGFKKNDFTCVVMSDVLAKDWRIAIVYEPKEEHQSIPPTDTHVYFLAPTFTQRLISAQLDRVIESYIPLSTAPLQNVLDYFKNEVAAQWKDSTKEWAHSIYAGTNGNITRRKNNVWNERKSPQYIILSYKSTLGTGGVDGLVAIVETLLSTDVPISIN
jgi:hypothetical protein